MPKNRGMKIVLGVILAWIGSGMLLEMFGAEKLLGGLTSALRPTKYLEARLTPDVLYVSFDTEIVQGTDRFSRASADGPRVWTSLNLVPIQWIALDGASQVVTEYDGDRLISQYSKDSSGINTVKAASINIVKGYDKSIDCPQVWTVGGCPAKAETAEGAREDVMTVARNCAPCLIPASPFGSFILAQRDASGVRIATISPPVWNEKGWAWHIASALMMPGRMLMIELLSIGYRSH